MITTNRILAVALIAALAGGSLGAILMHSTDAASVVAPTPSTDTAYPTAANRNAVLTTKVADPASNLGAGDSGNGWMTASNLVNRNATSRASTSRVYNNHAQPRGRSFWSKHRDKLTLAMGTGGGALIGALIGGGKGAGIGALAGAGGSALYTYKLRNRHPR